MNDSLFMILFKIQAACLILIKVFLLLKYFLFAKYKTSEWKAHHLIYFPAKDIFFSKSYTCIMAKQMQNNLSMYIIHSAVTVAVIRGFISFLF